MNYNNINILSIFNRLKDLKHLNIEYVESGYFDFLYDFFSYTYYFGSSKVVIVPDDSDIDYVIKIPFNEYSYETGSFKNWSYRNIPLTLANTNKIHYWDYCFNELYRYHIAKQNRYEHLFAKIKLIGQVGMFPIYIQQKINASQDEYKSISKEKHNSIKTSINKKGIVDYHIDIDWLASIEEIYGTKYMLDFVDFLHKQNWDDDLTKENVGYTLQGEPIIFDFAGFND